MPKVLQTPTNSCVEATLAVITRMPQFGWTKCCELTNTLFFNVRLLEFFFYNRHTNTLDVVFVPFHVSIKWRNESSFEFKECEARTCRDSMRKCKISDFPPRYRTPTALRRRQVWLVNMLFIALKHRRRPQQVWCNRIRLWWKTW